MKIFISSFQSSTSLFFSPLSPTIFLIPKVLDQFFHPFSSIKPSWNSTTNFDITHPTLLLMESCTTMLQLKQIQAHMTHSGLISDLFPVSRLITFCALSDSGDIRHAHLLFTQIERPNTYVWNTMIRGYCRAKFPAIGFDFFRKMVGEGVEMDCRSFVFALKSCERVAIGNSVHCRISKVGFDSDLLVRNGLVHFYAEHGWLCFARQLFDESSVRDVVSWTTMIDGYAKWNYPDEAVQLFDSMQFSNVEPNEITMIAVLSAYSQKGNLRLGKSIHKHIQDKSVNFSINLLNALLDMYVKCGCLISARGVFDNMVTRDVFSWTSMVNGYAKCGELDLARVLFNEMPERNMVSWNAMIAGYSQNNQPKEALNLFREMVESGLVPIENTLVCVLSACSQLSCLDLGLWIHHNYIDQKWVQRSLILGNAFIDMYAKCGSINTAAKLFNEMPERNLVSWNSIIAGYAAHGGAKQALALFEQMRSAEFKPDDITLLAVLSACSHGGLVSKGREYFKNMERDFGIVPKVEHYACLIDLYGRIGLLEEAHKLITQMPMEPSEAAWGALLNACRIHGNVELAKLAATKLIDLDPEDSGIYVLLATTYAKRRQWRDVSTVRNLMRKRGVKKSPGHSLIELGGEFHEFLVADESHPKSKEIYKLLNDVTNSSEFMNLHEYSDDFLAN